MGLLIVALGCQSPPIQLPPALVKPVTVSFDYATPDTIYTLSVDTTRYRPEPLPQAWYWFWHQQLLQSRQGDYAGQLLHGEFIKQLRSGATIQKGEFSWGLPEGYWRTWSVEGALVAAEEWKDGQRHGKAIYFDAAGQKLAEGEYRKGLKQGTWVERAPDGTYLTRAYKMGQEVIPEPEEENDETAEATEGGK